ncbi:hypothetical protein SPF06_15395 [Sinomonas sp. JGH33]|uniref:DUF8094 domain-containing protein n=1 Tax=Sinomonas terricola TaxID=3110330 RepID=A0ABU5T9C5_9MICC|nr:hypothetical protein [Sinomonas sp. JGH33]MEA5456119.1 hypothetical protein [Sinomonas sp. JGH33]
MRVKTAAALLLLGLIALVAGIGQLTFWAPPQTVTATLPADAKAAPLTVIDTKLRSLRGGEAEVTIKGDGNFVLATGRPDDVAAWVGKTAHTTIDGASADGKQLTASFTDGEPSAPSPATADTFATAQNASGSLDYRWDLPDDGDWQLVLASDGTKPAPHEVTITWPSNETRPWAVPLIVLGALLAAAAVAFFVIRRGGPGARKPATDAAPQQGPASAGSAPERAERRSAKRVASAAIAVVVALVTGAGAAQATTAPSPSGSASTAPSGSSASASAAAPQEKVLVDEQLQRILDQVANTVAAGDQAKDAKQLEPRVAESALLARTQNYKIRASVATTGALNPVRSSRLLTSVLTVQRAWPRTVVAVTKGDGNATPQILTLRQDDARANYKLVEASPLLPGATFPGALKAGSDQLALDAKNGLAYSPNEALRGLGDRLTSPDAWKDKIPDNAYITDTLGYESDIVKASPNGDLTFRHNPTANDAVAYRMADGGAILVAPLDFTIEGTPKSSGDKLTVADDAAALAGGKEATTKMSLQFRESVVLYIPADGAKGQLTLLAATRNLVGASVG